jgi:DNA-binding transcriptional MerR regulator
MRSKEHGRQSWSVGEVAEASGITVRTLHHWDDLGLLSPARRRSGGRREYGPDELFRLYLVLALRGLGLDLESVRACLDGGVDPRRVLRDQLSGIDEAERALADLRRRIEGVLAGSGEEQHPADLLQLLAATRPRRADALEEYLTDEERAALEQGAANLGPRSHYVVEIEFPQLYRRMEALRRRGVPVDDDRVQGLVARMNELSEQLGGGEGAGDGVRRAWRADPAAMSGEEESVAGRWRRLSDFVEAAHEVRRSRI